MRGRLLLALFGLVVGLLLAEGAARVGERFRCPSYCALYCDRNRFCGWWHASDVAGWCQLCVQGRMVWRTYGRYNRRGLRDDRDIPYEPDGSFRILVLGDSFTEAHQVDVPFTALLERHLNAAAGRGPRFEVLNAGVSDWGTDNELLYFRTEGWKYRPDLVLLAFYTGNDVVDNYRQVLAPRARFLADKPYFELRDGRLVLRHFPLPPEPRRDRIFRHLRHFLLARSALYRLLRLRPPSLQAVAHAAPATVRALPANGQVFLSETPEPYRIAWRITRGLLLALRAAVEAHGGRFAVVIVNSREEISEDWQWTLTMQPEFRDSPHDFDKPNRLTGVLRFLFGSKDGLVAALLERARRDELAALAAIPADADLATVARTVWGWLRDPGHRGLLRLWTESYATSLNAEAGPWSGFARATVRDWLAVLARAQPPAHRNTAAGRAQRTAVLAVLRGAMLDLLATGERARTTRSVMAFLDAITPPPTRGKG